MNSDADSGLLRREQVRLVAQEVRRMPPLHFLVDLGATIVAWRAGAGPIAFVWLILMTICQTSRSFYVWRLYLSNTLPPLQMLKRMALIQTMQGAVHSLIIVIVFATDSITAQYVVSLIMLGVAAGAIPTAAGHLPSYLSWAMVFGSVLAGSWLSKGSVEGLVLALLLVSLIALFAMYVRDQGRTLATMVNLTETLRHARDRAEMERARAQAANEARTRFFASASHDLRQPLHALGINAATIRALAEQNQDPRLGRVGEVIHQALNESRSLLDSLLEVSELDAGAVTPQFSTVDVVALLQTVQQTCAPIASEKSLELVCEGAGGPLLAHTDAALLKRMVMNLVGNAIKFTQTGRITLRHASGSEPGGDVLIQVCDTGPGIEPGEQEKVFEEFYQIGNAERDRSRGLGLGLAIVRRIAALSGAKVTLLSEPGNGCVFEIHVPCANVDAVVPPMWDVDGESTWRVALKGKGYRVLIIDDEREVREAMDTFLSVLGWWPKAVGGESEALAVMAQGWSPQAIVLDFRMRGGRSGIEVLSVLREAGCQAPAVLVTGDTAPARIQSARGAGLPLLYKPVDGLQLARSIAGLIHSHSPLHQGSIPEPMRI